MSGQTLPRCIVGPWEDVPNNAMLRTANRRPGWPRSAVYSGAYRLYRRTDIVFGSASGLKSQQRLEVEMRVLLTSLGQLGEAVITSLSGEYEFRVLRRKPQGEIADAFAGDIRSFDSMAEAAEGIDAIVHTAGLWQ